MKHFILAILFLGCSKKATCVTDSDCTSGLSCYVGSCLSRPTTSGTFAINTIDGNGSASPQGPHYVHDGLIVKGAALDGVTSASLSAAGQVFDLMIRSASAEQLEVVLPIALGSVVTSASAVTATLSLVHASAGRQDGSVSILRGEPGEAGAPGMAGMAGAAASCSAGGIVSSGAGGGWSLTCDAAASPYNVLTIAGTSDGTPGGATLPISAVPTNLQESALLVTVPGASGHAIGVYGPTAIGAITAQVGAGFAITASVQGVGAAIFGAALGDNGIGVFAGAASGSTAMSALATGAATAVRGAVGNVPGAEAGYFTSAGPSGTALRVSGPMQVPLRVITVSDTASTILNGQQTTTNVSCVTALGPTFHAIAGGCFCDSRTILTASFPVSEAQWQCHCTNRSGGDLTLVARSGYALCMNSAVDVAYP